MRKEGRMKKDNKGFTLVELVIVIAIMAVLLGLIATNIAPMFVQSVKGSADDLLSKLSDARTASYARDGDNTFLRIECDSRGRLYGTVYIDGVAQDRDQLGHFAEDLTYSCSKGSGSGDTLASGTLSHGDSLYISFGKGTGEVNSFGMSSASGSDTDIRKAYQNIRTGSESQLKMSIYTVRFSVQRGDIRFDITTDGLTGKSDIKRIRS